MMQTKTRFHAERPSCSVVENIAHRIVQDVAELKHDLARDIESAYVEDIYTSVDLLNGQVSSADAARVVEICGHVPAELQLYRRETTAAAVQEMLDAFKNWPPDEVIKR